MGRCTLSTTMKNQNTLCAKSELNICLSVAWSQCSTRKRIKRYRRRDDYHKTLFIVLFPVRNIWTLAYEFLASPRSWCSGYVMCMELKDDNDRRLDLHFQFGCEKAMIAVTVDNQIIVYREESVAVAVTVVATRWLQ